VLRFTTKKVSLCCINWDVKCEISRQLFSRLAVAVCCFMELWLVCSTAAEYSCVCQWKSIAAGESVVLECTRRDNIDDVMFFAVSCRLFVLTVSITYVFVCLILLQKAPFSLRFVRMRFQKLRLQYSRNSVS